MGKVIVGITMSLDEYQVPLFVITHEAPAHIAKGENDNLTFTFVTVGIRSAISRAKDAAGDRVLW